MTGHIATPQFDPHAEAIDGAPADPWPVDPRLRDDRVKAAARKDEWFRNFIADDPAPEYSHLDALDGLVTEDSPNPPAQPEQHSMYSPMQTVVIFGSSLTIVLASVAFGYWMGMAS